MKDWSHIEGAKIVDGIWVNKHGICLDCNGGNPECTHNNIFEEGGLKKCAICGVAVQ